MDNSKLKIILDITPLKNGYYSDAARSGIFFTVKNILTELLKRNDIELYFNITRYEPDTAAKTVLTINREFSDSGCLIISKISDNGNFLSHLTDKIFCFLLTAKEKYCNNIFLSNIFRILNFLLQKTVKILRFSIRKKFCRCDNWNGGIFLSLMYAIPEHIKNVFPAENCFTLLYDTIPTIYSGTVPINPWYADLVKNLSANENYFAISQSTANDFKRLFPVIKDLDIPVIMLASAGKFSQECDSVKLQRIRTKYNIAADRKIVFSHCSLAPHKNLFRLARAFKSFNDESKEKYQLVFGGANAGEHKNKILESVNAASDTDKNFVFTGYIDDADLPALYSLADIFCFVSLYEGFGLPVIEAMSCGTPCLVSSGSSIPEVAGDAAVYVNPLDENDIASGLHKLAAQPELRRQLRQKGLQRSELFAWSNTVDTLICNIRKIMAEK